MHASNTRRAPACAVVVLLLLGLGALVGAAPAAATPWGTTGADYTGVLCRTGGAAVPLGVWTVNGTDRAYATTDIAGVGGSFPPAPTNGATGPLVAGQAGIAGPDIAALAYLIARHGDGSAAEQAEISADVAAVAGGGGLQRGCLGQGGTNAARAASRLADARRFAGPYTVGVAAPATSIPGAEATVTVVVRSSSGVGTPGLSVQVAAGTSTDTVVTGRDGLARARITVPTVAAAPVTATVTAATGLTYYATSPASVGTGATSTATGTATLRPVLHPDPRVGVAAAELLLSGGTIEPTATVTNSSGYAGTGTVTAYGPVAAAAGRPCSSVAVGAFTSNLAVWQGSFTFDGDGDRRAGTSPALKPGCYALTATVTTTDSSPAETRRSTFDAGRTITVSTLTLSSAATAEVAPAGTLRATVTGATPGRAEVSTTVVARGPRPIGDNGCTGVDFGPAATAATSRPVEATRSGSGLRSVVAVTGVDRPGCYALDARSVVTQDGKRLETSTPLGATGTTTAVLAPRVTVRTAAPSGDQGTAMAGSLQVTGTFGFPATVAVGLVRGTSVPITSCADARFPSAAPVGATTRVVTTGDNSYRFRTPVPADNACYAVTARLVLDDNRAVSAATAEPSDATVFLAGFRPRTEARAVVAAGDGAGTLRALLAYGIFALLIVGGCTALFVRTLREARDEFGEEPLWSWRPNRDDPATPDLVGADPARRPLPGGRPSPTGRPNPG